MPRNTDISNTDDIIDSRDVIARLEELESEIAALNDDASEAGTEPDQEELAPLMIEYDALKAFADEAADYAPDWHHGALLVRESHFTDYCQELVSDIDDMPNKIPSYMVIDWEATADNLRVDYTEVDFDGVTYLVR